MAQIVHDLAPGASLAFRTAFNGEQDFANGIRDLRNAGATVIVDDVSYDDEPMFQDGVVAAAIDDVEATGVDLLLLCRQHEPHHRRPGRRVLRSSRVPSNRLSGVGHCER